jgi:hypothetical protein
MLQLNKYNFASRFLNAFASDRYDQKQTSLIRHLSDVVWEVGFYDGTRFSGTVHLKVSSVRKDIDYLDIIFHVNTFGDKPMRIFLSHLLESQIDRYSRVKSDGEAMEYFFDDKVITDPARWYNIWTKFNRFSETLEKNADFDILHFTCQVDGNGHICNV